MLRPASLHIYLSMSFLRRRESRPYVPFVASVLTMNSVKPVRAISITVTQIDTNLKPVLRERVWFASTRSVALRLHNRPKVALTRNQWLMVRVYDRALLRSSGRIGGAPCEPILDCFALGLHNADASICVGVVRSCGAGSTSHRHTRYRSPEQL